MEVYRTHLIYMDSCQNTKFSTKKVATTKLCLLHLAFKAETLWEFPGLRAQTLSLLACPMYKPASSDADVWFVWSLPAYGHKNLPSSYRRLGSSVSQMVPSLGKSLLKYSHPKASERWSKNTLEIQKRRNTELKTSSENLLQLCCFEK